MSLFGQRKFKRYVPGREPVSASDLNARAGVLEKLGNVSADPPLEITQTPQGWKIRLAGYAPNEWNATVRWVMASGQREGPVVEMPEDVGYKVDCNAPDHHPETVYYPKYGRPARYGASRISSASRGDRCKLVRDDDGKLQLWILSEAINFKSCTTNVPKPPAPPDDPPPSLPGDPIFPAPLDPSTIPMNSPTPAPEPLMFNQSQAIRLSTDIAASKTEKYDVRDADFLVVSAMSPAWGVAVLTVEVSPDGRLWKSAADSPNTLASDDFIDIDCRLGIAYVRINVSTASGSAGSYAEVVFSKKAGVDRSAIKGLTP